MAAARQVQAVSQRACEKSGRMVTPAWPPTTGTSTFVTSESVLSAQNVFARTCIANSRIGSVRACGEVFSARNNSVAPVGSWSM